MSYSFHHPCYTPEMERDKNCKFVEKCLDRHFLDNAINSIHLLGQGNGHLGAGIIRLECQNFEPKEPV